MSTKHLTQGDAQPPKQPDKLRLYSMLYCPFAQRTRLVLKAKNIPHDIVNVNLIKKPDWLLQLNSDGKIPVLDTGDEIVMESLGICDFLDEKYPEPAMYSENKEADKELIKKIGPVVGVFTRLILEKENKSPQAWVDEFMPVLEVFEAALKERNSKFFKGNDKPGMVDYMLWPFAERAPITAMVIGAKLPFAEGSLPFLRAWKDAMRQDPVVSDLFHVKEKHFKVLQFHKPNVEPNYDEI